MSRERPQGQRFNEVQLDIAWAAIQTLQPALKHGILRERATEEMGRLTSTDKNPRPLRVGLVVEPDRHR